MAEKRSKSILSGLKNMLHLESEKPSKAASKPSPARRKPAASEKSPPPVQGAKKQASPDDAGTPPTPDPAAAPNPEKKKVQNQPWYRHRQRW